MSQVCELTGKRPNYGNKVSHSNVKTRARWDVNLRKKRYEIPELMQTVSILLSTRAIRTIDKHGGITQAIMKAKDGLLSERLQKVKNTIYRNRVKACESGKTGAPKAAKAPKTAAPVAAAPKAAKAKTAKKK
jgi:large subunit ribosomal protein L28